jgi:hypothetical protein
MELSHLLNLAGGFDSMPYFPSFKCSDIKIRIRIQSLCCSLIYYNWGLEFMNCTNQRVIFGWEQGSPKSMR